MNLAINHHPSSSPIEMIRLIDTITNAYKELNIGKFFFLISILPFSIFLLGLDFLSKREARKILKKLQFIEVKDEAIYDELKKVYDSCKKIEQLNIQDISTLPFLLRILAKNTLESIALAKEMRIVIGQKIYPAPEGVTEEQLIEMSNKLKASGFYEDFPDDDEDDCYNKSYILGLSKNKEK
jgi:inactivated superfamily I helicase